MSDRFSFPGPAEIIAHRGFSAAAPENTLAALRAALDAGADAVEFDLQIASDGVPVLFHDDTLDRTTNGRGPVGARSAAELGALEAGSWFGAAFQGEPVPTLGAALDLLVPWHGRIYPELKGVRTPDEVDRIVDEVAARGLLGRTVFIAMDWTLLERARAHEPDAAVGYIVRRASQVEEALERAAGDPRALLDFDKAVPLRDRDGAARARALGIPMAAWTVDDARDADRLLEAGVPRITTNKVDALLAWKRGLKGR